MSVMDNEYEHESYGMIRFARVSGLANFYGSELTQNNYVSLSIKTSYLQESLSMKLPFPDKEILRVRMSNDQFVDLITNMNTTGVPCTLERVGNSKMEQIPLQDSLKTRTEKMLENQLQQFNNKVNSYASQVNDILEKRTINKSDRKVLSDAMNKITQEINNNLSFYMRCFEEKMGDVVKEGKRAVEGHLNQTINEMGLQKLHELTGTEKPKILINGENKGGEQNV